MFNHIRQKKKREAVRRLSHGSQRGPGAAMEESDGRGFMSSTTSGRGSMKRVMEMGEFRMQRRRISADKAAPGVQLSTNPRLKRSHASPLRAEQNPSEQSVKTWSVIPPSQFGTAGVLDASQMSVFAGGAGSVSQQVPGAGTTASMFPPPSAGSNLTFDSGIHPSSGFAVREQKAAFSTAVASADWSANTTTTSSASFGTTFVPLSDQVKTAGHPASEAAHFQSGGGGISISDSTSTPFGAVSSTGSGLFSFSDPSKTEPQTVSVFQSAFPPTSAMGTTVPPLGISSSFASKTEGSCATTGSALGFPSTVGAGSNAASENTGISEANMPLGTGSGNIAFSFVSPTFPVSSSGSSKSNINPLNQGAGVFGKAMSSIASQSPEDKDLAGRSSANSTALVIREIPENFNKNAWLKRFYLQFGEVLKVYCNVNKKSATVTFKTHEAAEKAKRRGKILRAGFPPVTIFWKQQGRRRTISEDSSPKHSRSSSAFGSTSQEKSPKKSTRTDGKTSREDKEMESPGGTGFHKDLGLSSLPLAHASGERCRVLDAIEKKMRQGMKKQSDISSAKAVQGTCPDMCPEKERYMREEQRRLTAFEIIPGTDGSLEENPQVDHTKAIKEYDRSAADKEEPLPHELRPISVLKTTMDYLAVCIMDNQQHSWADWFEFLWNRTRAIRKDITQQHLRNPECADLVEKTARFHIFCAHFLCEEGLSTFDDKINTENLTKCLQTLKQFYDDLFKDNGVVCPSEAEFRAYDILLNLNEGDILRQVMCYRPEVQESPEVRFATQIFSALNSNNFVRFFKLVGETNYLSACLTHRYFAQVRTKALRTLNYAFSISNRNTSFPLKELVVMLGFEDENEAAEFCSFHGLVTDEESVSFLRTSFVEPESKFPQRKANLLIESKRSCPIGEVVYNGPLPPPSFAKPTSSFNEEGQYIGGIHLVARKELKENFPPPAAAPHQETGFPQPMPRSSSSVFGQTVTQTVTRLPISTSAPQFPSQFTSLGVLQKPVELAKPSIVYTGEEIKEIAKKLFLEVLNEMYAEITKEAMDKVHKCLVLSDELAVEIREQLLVEYVADIVKSTLADEVRLKRLAKKRGEERQQNLVAIFFDVTNETISEECHTIALGVIRVAQQEALEEARKKASLELSESFTEQAVNIELQRLASEVIHEEKAKRDAALRQIAEQLVKRRISRYYNRWREAYRTRIHVKRLLYAFPATAPLISATEQLQNLLNTTDPDSCVMQVSSLRSVTHANEIHDALQSRQAEALHTRNEACKPLDVPQLLADSLRTHPVVLRRRSLAPGSPLYWKLVISLPGVCEGVDPKTFEPGKLQVSPALIKEKFKRNCALPEDDVPVALRHKVELLSLYRAEIRQPPFRTSVFGICTKAVHGVLTNTEVRASKEARQFCGTNALLIVVSQAELQTPKDVHARITRLLQSKPPFPALPVFVLVVGRPFDTSWSRETISDALGINELRGSDWISACKISTIDKFTTPAHLNESMCGVVRWLGNKSALDVGLQTDSLKNFVEEGLQSHFFVPVYEDIALRKKARLDQQCPEVIVDLYNSVLNHLTEVVTSNRLRSVSWPITEFAGSDVRRGLPKTAWNSPENLQSSADAIFALKLPQVPAALDGTWTTESQLCKEFANHIAPQNSSLLNRVTWLLDRTKRSLEEVDFLSDTSTLSADQVPWAQVLDACVNFMLMSLHLDPGRSESEVYFFTEDREKFVFPAQWRRSINLSKEEAAQAEETRRRQSQNPTKSRDETLHDSWMAVEDELREFEIGFPVGSSPPASVPVSVQEINDRLSLAIGEAKRETRKFDEFLLGVLEPKENPIYVTPSVAGKQRMAGTSKYTELSSVHVVEGLALPNLDYSVNLLEGSLVDLQGDVKSQRRSDDFAERRLKKFLAS